MRCYFTKGGHIACVEPLDDIMSDQEAIEKSRELFAARKGQFDGYEVWKGDCMVLQEPPTIDGPPTPMGADDPFLELSFAGQSEDREDAGSSRLFHSEGGT
jgi:hypothetical protein